MTLWQQIGRNLWSFPWWWCWSPVGTLSVSCSPLICFNRLLDYHFDETFHMLQRAGNKTFWHWKLLMIKHVLDVRFWWENVTSYRKKWWVPKVNNKPKGTVCQTVSRNKSVKGSTLCNVHFLSLKWLFFFVLRVFEMVWAEMPLSQSTHMVVFLIRIIWCCKWSSTQKYWANSNFDLIAALDGQYQGIKTVIICLSWGQKDNNHKTLCRLIQFM